MAKGRSEEADLETTSASTAREGTGKTATSSGTGKTSRAGAKPNGPTGEGGAPKRSTAAKGGAGRGAAATKGAAAAKGAAGKATTGSVGRKPAGGKRATDLRKDLREFAATRPQGWSHDDWLRFLDDLQARGHNINDRDAIGSMLERERLALALEKIPGVGPQRVRNIADRYGYLWRLKETDADQLSREADVPKSVADKVIEALGR